MQLFAPAKINLSFEIRGPRADGFHEVETLMVPISLADRLEIERRDHSEGINFTCDEATLSTGDDNLVMRAAVAYFAAAKTRFGVGIKLQKQIPHGAGLGGGSSDAASTLLGLNEISASPLAINELSRTAAQIGSDVPFFLYRSAAVCRGRGEIVEPVQIENSLPLLLLKPSFGVPTPSAYARWKDSRELPGISYEAQQFAGIRLVNDLERPVFEKYLFLARLKMWLKEQPEVGAALLSGSGSTVFAILRNADAAASLTSRARAELDPELWACPCESIATRPR